MGKNGYFGGGKEAFSKSKAAAVKQWLSKDDPELTKHQHKLWSSLPKYKPYGSYTPVADWATYDIVQWDKGSHQNWVAPLDENIYFTLDEETPMNDAENLHAVNVIAEYVSGWTKPTPHYGKVQYTTNGSKLFPISGTYVVKDKQGVIDVTLADHPQDHSVVAVVKIPVELVVTLSQVEAWLKRAITAGAMAAVQSVTTMDAFDRLLDDPQYRDVLRTIIHDYLKGRPADAIELGLSQLLAQATAPPSMEDL